MNDSDGDDRVEAAVSIRKEHSVHETDIEIVLSTDSKQLYGTITSDDAQSLLLLKHIFPISTA